ncbi:MAG: hypothetical protein HRU75_15020 [Planctomycetia bacterium]|nr:MAG: hypothetical protein HRU75_15020 [Planctomycetia bacterium]
MAFMNFRRFTAATCVTLVALTAAGCAGGASGITSLFGSPFEYVGGNGGGAVTPGGTSTGGARAGAGSAGEGTIDPCTLPDAQKFVRISMRNQATNDFVHYFMILIAFVQTDEAEGAVCERDVPLYTSFGYTRLAADTPLGTFCIPAGSLVYFHEAGRFRKAGGSGTTGLGSAIAPAQGTNATFDEFFVSGGAQVPVPNIILFHNPGTGDGARLQISFPNPDPCGSDQINTSTPLCQQDSFYYVDARDQLSGSTALGVGSGRRVSAEIQGTGCECSGFQNAFQSLRFAAAAQCSEFARGGSIEYVFVRDDRTPAFPQLVWRVTAANGAVLHDFDPRSGVR